MINYLVMFACGLATGLGIMAFLWLSVNRKAEVITDEQIELVWKIVSGRSAGGDPRAYEIVRKWFRAICTAFNTVGENL